MFRERITTLAVKKLKKPFLTHKLVQICNPCLLTMRLIADSSHADVKKKKQTNKGCTNRAKAALGRVGSFFFLA